VMHGFLDGAEYAMEAYNQTFQPQGNWPIIGGTAWYPVIDELLGIGTTVGIIVLIIIRQRSLRRGLNRFEGSDRKAAYFVEVNVLGEDLGMNLVKAGKVATYGGANPYTDFFTMQEIGRASCRERVKSGG